MKSIYKTNYIKIKLKNKKKLLLIKYNNQKMKKMKKKTLTNKFKTSLIKICNKLIK